MINCSAIIQIWNINSKLKNREYRKDFILIILLIFTIIIVIIITTEIKILISIINKQK